MQKVACKIVIMLFLPPEFVLNTFYNSVIEIITTDTKSIKNKKFFSLFVCY